MVSLELLGPTQDIYLCRLSEDLASTRVHIATKESGHRFLACPGARDSTTEFTTTGKDRLFFLERPNVKEKLGLAEFH